MIYLQEFLCKKEGVVSRAGLTGLYWVTELSGVSRSSSLSSSSLPQSQPLTQCIALHCWVSIKRRPQINCNFLKITQKEISAVITIQWFVVRLENSYLLHKWEKCCVHCVRFQEFCQNEKKMICEELARLILLSPGGRAGSGLMLMLLITGVCEAAGADIPHNLRTTRDKNCHCKKQGLVTQSWHQERSITPHHLILISSNTPRTEDL